MPPQVGCTCFSPFLEPLVINHSSCNRKDKECQNVDEHGQNAVTSKAAEGLFADFFASLTAKADDYGQGNNTQNIINYRSP